MKRKLCVFVVLLMILSGMGNIPKPAFAVTASGICGDHLHWSLDNNGVLTIGGNSNMSLHHQNVVVDWYNTDGTPWYPYRTYIREVIIEEGVTSVDVRAFIDCTEVKTVSIPLSMYSMGFDAFVSCAKLTDVYYPGDRAAWESIHFANGTGNDHLLYANIHFGGQQKNIPVYDEEIDTAYTIDANGTLRISGTGLMDNFGSGIPIGNRSHKLQLPYMEIREAPWYKDRAKIKKVIIEEGVTTICANAFYDCGKLTDVSIPNSIYYIDGAAFQYCDSLKKITIPDGVHIGTAVFLECMNLENIKLPGDLEEIKAFMFYNCTSLETITIPATVKEIGENAFGGCKKLKSIIFEGTREQWNQLEIGPYNTPLTNADIRFNNRKASGGNQPVPKQKTAQYGVLDVNGWLDGNSNAWDVSGYGTFDVYIGGKKEEDDVSDFFDDHISAGTMYEIKDIKKTAGHVYKGKSIISGKIQANQTTNVRLKFLTVYNIKYNKNTTDSVSNMPTSQQKEYGERRKLSNLKPIRNGYTFRGWATTTGGGPIYQPGEIYSKNESVTLYAKWEKKQIQSQLIIKTPPQNATADVGSAVTFSVEASGSGLSYQWETKGPNSTMWANSSLQGNKTYKLTVSVTKGTVSGTQYRCVVKDSTGHTKTSQAATLTVREAQNSNNQSDVVASGTCGTRLKWTLDKRGTLTISGSGKMDDYEEGKQPWHAYKASIKSVVIENIVTSVGNNAFNCFPNLSSVTIANSVTRIGNYAFCANASLKSIMIPASVETIGFYALNSNNALTNILVSGSNKQYASKNGVLYNKNFQELLVCPAGIKGTVNVPDSVTVIGEYAFRDCEKLENVILSSKLVKIETNAFWNCNQMKSIKIPKSLQFIGEDAFSYCSRLKDIYYAGTATDWKKISIHESNKSDFGKAKMHYQAK